MKGEGDGKEWRGHPAREPLKRLAFGLAAGSELVAIVGGQAQAELAVIFSRLAILLLGVGLAL